MSKISVLVAFIGLSFFQPILGVADEKPKVLTIATWNVEWFFDAQQGDNYSDLAREKSAPSDAEWNWKLDQVARVINEIDPTILALQEVENRQVLQALTKKLADKYRKNFRIAFIEGWDRFTEQDVAIIYRSGLVHYRCHEQTKEMFDSKDFHNLTKHLVAKFEWGEGDEKEELTVITAHLRATAGKEDVRKRQGRLLHNWISEHLIAGENVVALGDFNTEENAGSVNKKSDMGAILGWETKAKDDDLFDLNENIAPDFRQTHLGGREFDRICVSRSMMENDRGKKKDLVFSKIQTGRAVVVQGQPDTGHFDNYYEIGRNERDISDHYPVVAEFLFK